MAAPRTTAKPSVHFDSQSDSDSDGPESVPLSQAKRHAKEFQDSVANTLAKRRKEEREKNRKRDEQLKAQAGKRKLAEEVEEEDDEESEDDDGEGEEEHGSESHEDEEEEESDEDEDEEFLGLDAADLASSDVEPENEEASSNGEESDLDETVNHKTQTRNPKHLPDHLFTAAFSQAPASADSSKSSKRKDPDHDDDDDELQTKRRRKHRNNSRKDVSVGSRTFRVMSTSSTVGARPGATSGLQPPAKARQFLDRNLALKAAPPVVTVSGSSKPPNRNDRARSWQRRPANIGVMRPSIHGPAASFVRNG